MLLTTEKFKDQDKSKFTLNIIVLEKEIIGFAVNNLTRKIEAFDKVGNINDFNFTENNFSDVNVVAANSEFTLIPEGVFSEKETNTYLNFSSEILDSCAIIVSKNIPFSLNTIWYLNQDLKSEITQIWPGSTFSHLIANRLNSVNENENERSNTLFIDFFKQNISIILFTNKELQIANQFKISGEEDALYYLLFTLEQATTKVEEMNVILNGTKTFQEKLSHYFKSIQIAENMCTSTLKITEEDIICCALL